MHIGIDVGGTKVQAAAYRDGTLTPSRKVATPHDYGTLLSALAGLCGELTGAEGATAPAVERVAVGLPGRVTGERVEWVPNLRYLDDRALAADLSERLGADVLLANDAQLMLLGEVWKGAAAGTSSAALISLGTGIGGALMYGGRVVRGAHGSAGAFGWLTLDLRAPRDPDHGDLELRASGRALEEVGRSCDPPMTPYEIVEQARAGRAPATEIMGRTAHALGVAAAGIASVADPGAILFCGGLSEAYDLMADDIGAAFRSYASPSVLDTTLTVAHLGQQAALYGTVRAAQLGEEPAFG